MHMAVVTLDQGGFAEAVARPGILVIDWWARWCAPCKFFGPIFERVAAKNPDGTFAKVDVDEQPQLAGSLGIQAMPTLSIYRDGVLLFQQAGALPEAALEDLLRQARALDMVEVRRKVAEHARHSEPRRVVHGA
jgi:thioredoxin 1